MRKIQGLFIRIIIIIRPLFRREPDQIVVLISVIINYCNRVSLFKFLIDSNLITDAL